MERHDNYSFGSVWFMGVVEDRDDPLKMGRIRVRCFHWHTEDKGQLPTEHLPWAQVVQPVESASMGDVGRTPIGPVPGTWVVGLFMDGSEAQRPLVTGTVPGIPVTPADTTKGFSDPSGAFPGRLEEPDVNRLARNDSGKPHQVLAAKESTRTTGVGRALSDDTWDEPSSRYAAQYGKNHVIETEGGHIVERDDTPGAERLHEYHKTGTFKEVGPDGEVVLRIVTDDYEVVLGDRKAYVAGDCDLTVAGTTRIKMDKLKLEVDDLDVKAGTYNLQVTGDTHVRYDGDWWEHKGADKYSRHGPGVDYSCPADPPRTSGISCVDVEDAS